MLGKHMLLVKILLQCDDDLCIVPRLTATLHDITATCFDMY